MSDAQKRRFAECSPLQQMMLIVFSRVLRQRKYYDASYFFQHQLNGVTVFIIDLTNPFIDRTIADSIDGAATAADLGYLQTVQMIFKLLNDNPGHFVERYAIFFNEDNGLELISPNRRGSLSPLSHRSWNYEEILKMSATVDEVCDNLDPLPPPEERMGGLGVRFRLDYSRASPKGYQAPFFERSNFKTLYFSDLLPAQPVEIHPLPQRVLSQKASRVRSTLSVQSLLIKRNSAPAAVPSRGETTPQATHADSTMFSVFNIKPRQDPQVAVLGNDDVDDGEKSTEVIEDEDDREEIETTRGDEEGRESRKRWIEGEEEGEAKRVRSSSSSPIDYLKSLRRDFDDGDATLLSTSLEMGNSTVQKSLKSSESPEISSATSRSVESGDAREEEKNEEEDGTEQEDLNETFESDGGEALFID